MIKVLLDQYYRCRPGLPLYSIHLCIQQNAGQTAFGTEKAEIGLAKGWCGEREEGEGNAFPFSAQILYLRFRCKTLYINRKGFRPA